MLRKNETKVIFIEPSLAMESRHMSGDSAGQNQLSAIINRIPTPKIISIAEAFPRLQAAAIVPNTTVGRTCEIEFCLTRCEDFRGWDTFGGGYDDRNQM
jgi:hypothetical protein